jgi:hypothetical protein
MGAAEDVAVVRRGYEAFNTGDMDTLTELFEPGASWHTPGRSSLAGDHQGVTPRLPTSASWESRPEGPSGPSCGMWLEMVTAASSQFITTAGSKAASTWMLTAASSSS